MAQAIERSRNVVDRMVGGVEFLLKKNKVTVISGRGTLKSANAIAVKDGDDVEAHNVILATGSHARSLPGVEIDGDTLITSRQALELRAAPESSLFASGGPSGGVCPRRELVRVVEDAAGSARSLLA